MEARHGVYILVNSETHGIVKIGETTRHVNDRIPELHQTGTIGRYKCAGFIKTDGQPALLERKLHGYFREQHVNNEYFRVSPETVIQAALKLMGDNDNVVISPFDVAKEQAKQQAEAYEKAGREAHAKRKEELRRKNEEADRKYNRSVEGVVETVTEATVEAVVEGSSYLAKFVGAFIPALLGCAVLALGSAALPFPLAGIPFFGGLGLTFYLVTKI